MLNVFAEVEQGRLFFDDIDDVDQLMNWNKYDEAFRRKQNYVNNTVDYLIIIIRSISNVEKKHRIYFDNH